MAHPNFHPHHSFLVGWLSWLVGHNLMIILLFCRSLKKYWCKTSYLDSLQASQNLMNKFQDGDSSSQLCHTSCTVHLLCCNIGEFFCFFFVTKSILVLHYQNAENIPQSSIEGTLKIICSFQIIDKGAKNCEFFFEIV